MRGRAMSYESPIQATLSEIATDFSNKQDEYITARVSQTLAVDVDKEELLRALKYDREQYKKGYADRDKEIVHCEGCKYLVVLNSQELYGFCKKHKLAFEPFEDDTRTNYCSWGERKEK